jgi:hypothetical protein
MILPPQVHELVLYASRFTMECGEMEAQQSVHHTASLLLIRDLGGRLTDAASWGNDHIHSEPARHLGAFREAAGDALGGA